MSGRIYLLNGDSTLLPMEETPYDSEAILQRMLAQHPDLLAGEQINSDVPRRWLLVTREMAVPGDEGGNARWSLDHLFLDQDAIPTLVEVKRSSDTRIRREVIGQMLDYAANAAAYWPVEEVCAKFETRCEKDGVAEDDLLTTFLGAGYDVEEFWQRVKTNLQAGRIRMVFLADSIPAELRRIVEFLNEQMDPAEVIAIEVKQFVGTGVKTLVPRVLGQSETARQKKSASGSAVHQWDEETFFEALLSRRGELECDAARSCYEWARERKLRTWWGQGKGVGSLYPVRDNDISKHFIFSLRTNGTVQIQFQYMRVAPFENPAKRKKLAQRFNEIPGVNFPDEALAGRPSFPLELLVPIDSRAKFLATCDWVIAEIDAHQPNAPSSSISQ